MPRIFSTYQVFVIAILAFLQFSIILDFMVLSPLSAILLEELHITTSQFGMVVSAYAWSAGISSILAAGIADRFDRKKLLLFFYGGFIIGTYLCSIADNYSFLLIARISTGVFGGVIGSVIYAVVSDLFALEVRGRVMGFLQMAFAGAQVLGLPIGLYLANVYGWQSPFLMISGLCIIAFIVIWIRLKPVNAHLAFRSTSSPMAHFLATFSNRVYVRVFASTILLATGGFMLMPFGAAFAVNNLGVSLDALPLLYAITGASAMIFSPMIGKLSDSLGKYPVFTFCSIALIITVCIYCNLGPTPFWLVALFSVVMFANVSGRMVSSSALITAVPDPPDRGAFMSINSSISMVSGGIASMVAGTIVYQTQSGFLENYDILGYVVSGATIITIALMYMIHKIVRNKHRTVGSTAV